MTVETTSFLSGAKITTNGSEKSAKFLKNHKNLIIFLFAIILLLFCVSASVLQVSRPIIFPHVFLFFSFRKNLSWRVSRISFYWRKKRFSLTAIFALYKPLIHFYTHSTWENNFPNFADMDYEPNERNAGRSRVELGRNRPAEKRY